MNSTKTLRDITGWFWDRYSCSYSARNTPVPVDIVCEKSDDLRWSFSIRINNGWAFIRGCKHYTPEEAARDLVSFLEDAGDSLITKMKALHDSMRKTDIWELEKFTGLCWNEERPIEAITKKRYVSRGLIEDRLHVEVCYLPGNKDRKQWRCELIVDDSIYRAYAPSATEAYEKLKLEMGYAYDLL